VATLADVGARVRGIVLWEGPTPQVMPREERNGRA
jgi:hypothetical protein